MKDQIKAPKNIQLSDEEIANLSGAQFKKLVIRMLTELVEYGCKTEEKVKLCKVKYRKMYREPTVMGKMPGLKQMIWTRRKK